MSLFENGVVELYGHRFRVMPDPTQEALASTFPGKIVIGDPRRVDDPIASSYIMQDWTGGMLKRWMDPSVDIDRFYYSTCATWYTRQLTLNGLVRFSTPYLPAPGAPVLSQTTTTGTIAAGVYTVQIAYSNDGGTLETAGGPSAQVTTTTGTSTITINSPVASTGATGWYAYVSQVGGNVLTRQQALGSPTAIGTNLTLTAPPTSTGTNPLANGTALLWTDGSLRNVRAGAAYGTVQYLGYDEHLCKLDTFENVVDLGTVAATPNVITNMKVYRLLSGGNAGQSWLVISYVNTSSGATGWATYNGTTIAAGTGTMAAMTIWDSKLIRCDDTGALFFSTDLSTWTALPGQNVVPLTQGSVTDLNVYPDGFWGLDEIQIATTVGLFWYDEIGQLIRKTRLNDMPALPNNGRPLVLHRGNLYVPAPATQILRYTGDTVSPEGLDRDDGLAANYRGQITWIASTLNFLVAATMSTSVTAPSNADYAGDEVSYASTDWGTQGYAALWMQNRVGGGWHNLYSSPTIGTQILWVGASDADGRYRLFFGDNGNVGIIDLYADLANPLDNTIQQFQQSGVHVTPWNEQGWSEIEKLAIRQKFGAKGTGIVAGGATCTTGIRAPCNIVVEYGMDYDETDWFPLATITTASPAPSYFGTGNVGQPNKAIRYRYTLNRCDNQSHTPVLVWSSLAFLKVQDARWSYELTLDLTTTEQGKTPADQAALLRSMSDPAGLGATLGTFKFVVDGVYQSRLVKVTEFVNLVKGGNKQSGQARISLVAF